MSEVAPVSERLILVERRLKLTERACSVCGTVFVGWGKASICSKACANRRDYDRHSEARKAARRARYSREKASSPSRGEAPSSQITPAQQRRARPSEVDA